MTEIEMVTVWICHTPDESLLAQATGVAERCPSEDQFPWRAYRIPKFWQGDIQSELIDIGAITATFDPDRIHCSY